MNGRYSVLDSGCWLWHGAYSKDGYGYVYVRPSQQNMSGQWTPVIRVVLARKMGRAIQPGMLACHTCNNKYCVNPVHLYEGTYSQNGSDAWKAGALGKVSPANRRLLITEILSGANVPKSCAAYGVKRNWYADHKRLVRLGKRKPTINQYV